MAGERRKTIDSTARRRRDGEIPEWRVEDFRTIVTLNADAMIVLDRDGYVSYVNPAAESLFNLSSAEMVGANFGFPVLLEAPVEMYILRGFKDFVAAEMRLVEVVWAGEPSYLLSFRDLTDRIMAEKALSRARDELEVKVRERTCELSETDQRLRREIAERKRDETALRESEEKFRELAETAPTAICILQDGRFQYVNNATAEITGCGRNELRSMEFISVVHPDFRGYVAGLYGDWLSGRIRQARFEIKVLRKDGTERWNDISVSTIDYRGRPGLIMTAVDVTERKRVEEALTEAKQRAELYLDLMGHDINNLNHSAMGYLELALQALETEKRLRLDDKVLIERPMQAMANSSALIDNVRKLQRLTTEGIETMPTDLNKIFRELGSTSFHSSDRDFLLNISQVPGMMVEANELLKDVFVNLVNNAVKHSDEEKPLTVSVKAEPANENGRKYYRCVVEDDGPGIPDKLKGKLFHRFQRGSTRAHGKGLGLYIVRTLVEGYHGKVWVEDRVPGDYTKGARFVIMLPAAEK